MERKTKCPECGFEYTTDDWYTSITGDLLKIMQECPECGKHYNEYYKINYIGSEANGRDLYPADGETEESMKAAGVELWYR